MRISWQNQRSVMLWDDTLYRTSVSDQKRFCKNDEIMQKPFLFMLIGLINSNQYIDLKYWHHDTYPTCHLKLDDNNYLLFPQLDGPLQVLVLITNYWWRNGHSMTFLLEKGRSYIWSDFESKVCYFNWSWLWSIILLTVMVADFEIIQNSDNVEVR